jgi:hypothetical protein
MGNRELKSGRASHTLRDAESAYANGDMPRRYFKHERPDRELVDRYLPAQSLHLWCVCLQGACFSLGSFWVVGSEPVVRY